MDALQAEFSALVAEIQAAITAKRWPTAEGRATELTERFPTSPAGPLLLAQTAVAAKQPQRAVDILKRCAAAFPNDAQVHLSLAQTYAAIYRHGAAEPHLQTAVRLDPEWTDARFLLGQNLFKAGRFHEAIPHLQRATDRRPDDFRSNFLLGTALANEGELESAQRFLTKAAALNPSDTMATAQAAEVSGFVGSGTPRPAMAKWPQAATDFDDFAGAIRRFVIPDFDRKGLELKPGVRVVTQGSCFADNLARSLRRYPLKVEGISCGEEHNSTFANRIAIQWMLDGPSSENTTIAAENLGADQQARYRQVLESADIYVYTLGVAAGFFHRDTGDFMMPRATATSKIAQIRRGVFRTSSVAENVENLLYIVDRLTALNPRIKIVLSVSPVPLQATLELNSAVVADCVSKSTLRVAAHEVLKEGRPNVIYWPSFEMVRWLGAHRGPVFGNDDGSSNHVDFSVIDAIIDAFVETMGSAGLEPLVPT